MPTRQRKAACAAFSLAALGLALLFPGAALSAVEGHEECARQLQHLSRGQATSTPNAQDWSNARETYFACLRNAVPRSTWARVSRSAGSCAAGRASSLGPGPSFMMINDQGRFRAQGLP